MVVVSDVLLLYFMESCKQAFSGCSVKCITESSTMQRICSGPFWVQVEVGNDC